MCLLYDNIINIAAWLCKSHKLQNISYLQCCVLKSNFLIPFQFMFQSCIPILFISRCVLACAGDYVEKDAASFWGEVKALLYFFFMFQEYHWQWIFFYLSRWLLPSCAYPAPAFHPPQNHECIVSILLYYTPFHAYPLLADFLGCSPSGLRVDPWVVLPDGEHGPGQLFQLHELIRAKRVQPAGPWSGGDEWRTLWPLRRHRVQQGSWKGISRGI